MGHPHLEAHDRGRLEIRRPPGLPSLELHEGVAFEHTYPRHWHDDLFVTAITDGAGIFGWGRTEHRATAGMLVFIAPGEVHSHAPGRGGRSFRSLHAGNRLVSDLLPELPKAGRGNLRSVATGDPKRYRDFLGLHRLLGRGGNRLREESRLLELLAGLVRLVPSPDDPPPPASGRERAAVRRAREFLDDSGDARVSLQELAALAGLSPFHFHRLFRREIGMPPHEYQIRRRILRARVLLGRGEPAAHVAAATGFADQSHLTRHFKRVLGFPPSEWARRSKNVQDAAEPTP